MSSFENEKKLVLEYFNSIDNSNNENLINRISKYTSDDFKMRCTHPFNELNGAEQVANNLWVPIKNSFKPIQRRMDIFYAGINSLDTNEGKWVTSMGHLMGIFNKPFFGIQPNFKSILLRYAEFYKVENDKITEGAIFLDIINLMQQLGLSVIPESTGLVGITPGPMNHKGLKLNVSENAESRKTLELIHRMRDRLVKRSKMKSVKDELELDWHNDMIWWGPGGIGASYTIDGYIKGHTKPFQDGLEFIKFGGHILSSAEDDLGGWFGWPNLIMKTKGGYLGLTNASDIESEMRVVDLYRRDGDKIAENWIFIDHLHFLKLLGIDLLERNKQLSNQ
jgi:hypothetical protein